MVQIKERLETTFSNGEENLFLINGICGHGLHPWLEI
jgi:hypothetical protein